MQQKNCQLYFTVRTELVNRPRTKQHFAFALVTQVFHLGFPISQAGVFTPLAGVMQCFRGVRRAFQFFILYTFGVLSFSVDLLLTSSALSYCQIVFG